MKTVLIVSDNVIEHAPSPAGAHVDNMGAVAIVVLHQNAAGSWDIAEEIPLENSQL